MNQNDNHHDDHNNRQECSICSYFEGDMNENYFDFAQRMGTLYVCLACQKEAEDGECHMSSEVKKVIEMLANDFNDKELQNLNGLGEYLEKDENEIYEAFRKSYYEESCQDPQ